MLTNVISIGNPNKEIEIQGRKSEKKDKNSPNKTVPSILSEANIDLKNFFIDRNLKDLLFLGNFFEDLSYKLIFFIFSILS